MKRTSHFARRGATLMRSRRRRMQVKSIRRVQHKKRLIFFLRESDA